MRLQLTAKLRHMPGVEMNQPLRHLPLVACHVLRGHGLNAEFFTQFADQAPALP